MSGGRIREIDFHVLSPPFFSRHTEHTYKSTTACTHTPHTAWSLWWQTWESNQHLEFTCMASNTKHSFCV